MARPNRNKRWLLLDSTDGGYASAISALTTLSTSHGETLAAVASRWADVNVVYCACTDAERDALAMGPTLYLHEVNYSVIDNENASDTGVLTTTEQGDQKLLYGVLPGLVTTVPTSPVDRVVEWCKGNGADGVCWVAPAATGAEDGSSPWDRVSHLDISGVTPPVDVTDFNIFIFDGRFSRAINQGNNGGSSTAGASLKPVDGSSGVRALYMSDFLGRAEVMGAARIGMGVGDGTGTFALDTGTTYVARDTTGAGGGDPWFRTNFVFYDDGGGTGTLLIPELAASLAACRATVGTYFYDFVSANTWDFYINMGEDPTGKVYAPHCAGGCYWQPGGVYQDWIGFKIYGSWVFQATDAYSHWRAYNVRLGYSNANALVPHGAVVTEGTGAMDSLVTMTDYQFIGGEICHARAGHYSSSTSDVCPDGFVLCDTYIHHIALPTDHPDHIGGPNINTSAAGDSHSLAAFGAIKNVHCYNFRLDQVGPECIVWYNSGDNHNVPDTSLENTDGYTVGWPRAHCYPSVADPSQEKWVCATKNILVEDFYVTNIHPATGDYSAVSQMGLSNNGDAGDLINYAGQISNVVYRNGRLEGDFNDGAIRHKCSVIRDGSPPSQTAHRTFEFDRIEAYGAKVCVNIFGSIEDPDGNTAEASCWIHDSKFMVEDATRNFVYSVNHSNDSRRKREFNFNTYYGAGKWDRGAGETADTLAGWQALALGDDVHDPDSTATEFPIAAIFMRPDGDVAV